MEDNALLNGFVPAAPERDVLLVATPEPVPHLPAESAPKKVGPKFKYTYTEEIGLKIFEEVADNGRTLKDVLTDEGMPSRSAVYRWRAERPEFDRALYFAERCWCDEKLDECMDIADDGSHDRAVDESGDVPVVVVNTEVLARTKIRLNERWRQIVARAPKRYGRDPSELPDLPAKPGDNAKEINPKEQRELDPLEASLQAWRRAREAAA